MENGERGVELFFPSVSARPTPGKTRRGLPVRLSLLSWRGHRAETYRSAHAFLCASGERWMEREGEGRKRTQNTLSFGTPHGPAALSPPPFISHQVRPLSAPLPSLPTHGARSLRSVGARDGCPSRVDGQRVRPLSLSPPAPAGFLSPARPSQPRVVGPVHHLCPPVEIQGHACPPPPPVPATKRGPRTRRVFCSSLSSARAHALPPLLPPFLLTAAVCKGVLSNS